MEETTGIQDLIKQNKKAEVSKAREARSYAN
jgi:hypothetical protein